MILVYEVNYITQLGDLPFADSRVLFMIVCVDVDT